MRARLLFVFSLLVAGAVSACGGGGGGGGGGTPPTTQPTSTVTPTTGPTVAANPSGCVGVSSATRSGTGMRADAVGIQPPTNGATGTYTGSLTQTLVAVSPCPVGTATANATVAITATMTSATNEQDDEKDTYATNQTEVLTNATVDGTNYTESAETSTDLVGDSLTTTYSTLARLRMAWRRRTPMRERS